VELLLTDAADIGGDDIHLESRSKRSDQSLSGLVVRLVRAGSEGASSASEMSDAEAEGSESRLRWVGAEVFRVHHLPVVPLD
jgi:hypothetical protein